MTLLVKFLTTAWQETKRYVAVVRVMAAPDLYMQKVKVSSRSRFRAAATRQTR